MWSDNETDKDFLNFGFVADIAAEMILQADGRPISMGISGNWGVGKSSMMKLLAKSLKERTDEKYLFVEFNAWLYQGYDDTRAALMEVIARAILKKAEENEGAIDGIVNQAQNLLKRVNWLRLASASATTVAALAVGLPPLGLIGEGFAVVKGLTDGKVTQQDFDATTKLAGEAKGLVKDAPATATTAPKEIHDFREELEATLKKLGVTMVVLIDDLDRCLPPTAIATLEAMRLFLFLERTAFVIAADDQMIRKAVENHFKGTQLSEDLVTNYFDKLIQVPIRVPPLGTQDVRAYLMILFIENSTLEEADRDAIRTAICKRLGETWSGKRVDRAFVQSLIKDCPEDLALQLDLADRIAPILTSSKNIAGNPRLIKRFLNTLSIRKAIARAQGVNVDEPALAKMLLFERCGSEAAYGELLTAVNESGDGKADFLNAWEAAAEKDPKAVPLEGDWNTDFVREWLTLDPPLGEYDLRGIVYVSRERMPIITAADRLSSEGANVLEALLKLTTTQSSTLGEKLKTVPSHEVGQITERLLVRARAVEQWGTPPILFSLLTVATLPGDHVQTIARFLGDLPSTQITTPIVPVLADKPWAVSVLSKWVQDVAVSAPVKKAIANASAKADKTKGGA